MSEKAAICIENLRKTFNSQDFILNGINLEIPEHKITSVIGFSGTGKSVLIKHCLGLIKPTSGSIKVFDQNIETCSEQELIEVRKNFGILFQDSALFDSMSVLDNVTFPLREHKMHLGIKEIEKIASQKLSAVGLNAEHYKKLPADLSGGMRKRVGLARALSLSPKILVYDEPTTGLDPILTEVVDELITSTHKKIHATTLIISHDLFSAFRFSDNIAMLNEGKVLLSGPPQVFFDSKLELVQRFLQKGFRGRHVSQ